MPAMRGREGDTPETVEEYLREVPPDMRRALRELRKTIRAAAPGAEEVISYGMPAFRQNGMLVYYAAFKDHCSFFIGGPAARKRFAAELKPYVAGKGTVHFTPDRPLPASLVTRIVKARVAENLARSRRDRRGRPPRPKRARNAPPS